MARTRAEAGAHHIQCLMVAGHFAPLAGIDPMRVHERYLLVHADAFEWVNAPNIMGVSQVAGGGLVAAKPCVCCGVCIDRMSDC